MSLWQYRARLVRVIDGDTIRVLCDLGMSSRQEEDLRLLGVQAPESREPGGAESTGYTQAWLDREVADALSSWPLYVRTVKSPKADQEQRSFTRYLATVWANGIDDQPVGPSLNSVLAGWLSTHPEWGPGE